MRELQANYHQLSKYINSYLSVELLGGEIYKGILVHNNPSQKLFVLNNVRFGSTKFNGIHNFLYSQTYKIKFLTKFNDEVPNLPYEQDDDLVYEFRNHSQNDQDDQVEIDFSSLSKTFHLPISEDIFLIQKIDEATEPIEKLFQEKIIGFCVFGNPISRFGQINFLSFSCQHGTFIFKFEDQLIQLLKPLIESKQILKVMYQCELASDALWNLYEIKLDFVFDCRIYDFHLRHKSFINQFVHSCKYGKPPQMVPHSLDQCIANYMNISIMKFKEEYLTLPFEQLTEDVIKMAQMKTIFLVELSLRLKQLYAKIPKRIINGLNDYASGANDQVYYSVNNEKAIKEIIYKLENNIKLTL